MTAFTLTETLSRVITSCGGTSCTTVRSDTRTIRSIGNQISTRPGPLAVPSRRPSRNTTARSYSLRILRLEKTQKATATTMKTNPGPAPNSPFMYPPPRSAADLRDFLDVQHHVANPHHAHAAPLLDGSPGLRVPVLAVHEDAPLRIDVAQGRPLLRDESRDAGGGLGLQGPDDQGGEDRHDDGGRAADGDDHPRGHAEIAHRLRRPEEHERAHDQAGDPSQCQGAVAGD